MKNILSKKTLLLYTSSMTAEALVFGFSIPSVGSSIPGGVSVVVVAILLPVTVSTSTRITITTMLQLFSPNNTGLQFE